MRFELVWRGGTREKQTRGQMTLVQSSKGTSAERGSIGRAKVTDGDRELHDGAQLLPSMSESQVIHEVSGARAR